MIVADTSVVLNLCLLRRQDLLEALFDSAASPPEVVNEFERLAGDDDRFRGLIFPKFIEVRSATAIPMLLGTPRLHAGERATLALGLEAHADAILIDERAGRSFAKQLGMKPLGLLGVLIEGKRQGMVDSVGPLLERLERDARFWMSDTLRREILHLVGE